MGADRDGDLKVRQGAPTNPEHIDSEAWAALREAARRSGMPFGEWLKAKLLAGTADLPAPAASTARGGTVAVGDLQRRVSDLAGEIDRLARAEPPATPHRGSRIASPHGEGLVSALDALNARVEKLLQDPEKGSAAAATHLDETIRRLNERLESLAQEKRGDEKRTDEKRTETRLPRARPADSFERRMSEIARTVDTLNRKLDRGTPAQACRRLRRAAMPRSTPRWPRSPRASACSMPPARPRLPGAARAACSGAAACPGGARGRPVRARSASSTSSPTR